MGYTFFLVAVIVLAYPSSAHAYLDPGTGSYFLQIILAALLGATFAVKTFWRNIKSFIANLFNRRGSEDDAR